VLAAVAQERRKVVSIEAHSVEHDDQGVAGGEPLPVVHLAATHEFVRREGPSEAGRDLVCGGRRLRLGWVAVRETGRAASVDPPARLPRGDAKHKGAGGEEEPPAAEPAGYQVDDGLHASAVEREDRGTGDGEDVQRDVPRSRPVRPAASGSRHTVPPTRACRRPCMVPLQCREAPLVRQRPAGPIAVGAQSPSIRRPDPVQALPADGAHPTLRISIPPGRPRWAA
jgi:hypothetical protein